MGYLEITSFPTHCVAGQATYFDHAGKYCDFTFSFDSENHRFVAVLKQDGQSFFMTPITNERDEIVRFTVTFNMENSPEITFAYEEDITFYEPEEEFEIMS